jgi:hypothetical protein
LNGFSIIISIATYFTRLPERCGECGDQPAPVVDDRVAILANTVFLRNAVKDGVNKVADAVNKKL